MKNPRQNRASSQAWALVMAIAVAGCGGAEDAGLEDGNLDPRGGGASNNGGADAGGTGSGGGTEPGGGGGTNAGGAGDASGGGHAGSGGGSDGTEDCLNGRDDDGDGAIDCADDDCVEVACVAEVPDGWSGPIVIREGSRETVECSGGYPIARLDVGTRPRTAAASCEDCGCGVNEDQCEAIAYTGRSCDGVSLDWEQSGPFDCSEVPRVGVGFGFKGVYVGGCGAIDAQPDLPIPHWDAPVVGCGPKAVGGGCESAGVCAPTPADGSNVCIYKDGAAACPSSYPARTIQYQRLEDDRCSGCCTSAAPPWSCEVVSATAFSDQFCTDELKTDAGQCLLRDAGRFTVTTKAPATDSCEEPKGAMGDVRGADPITACCVE